MDLTQSFPRGPRERLAGIAMLPRTIDKARARIAGTLGEYFYDCPMDKRLFETLGVSGEDFAALVARAPDDDAVVAALRARGPMPSGDALESHNAAIGSWSPSSDEGRARFIAARDRVAPGRDDVRTWTDLLDVEEGRAPLFAG